MEDDELKEYEEAQEEQRYQAVFFKGLLMQAGLVVPAFMLGRAFEADEAGWWPNLMWFAIMVIASGSILYTIIDYFKFKPK